MYVDFRHMIEYLLFIYRMVFNYYKLTTSDQQNKSLQIKI